MYYTECKFFSWLSSVKTILDECGFSYIWDTQICISEIWLKFMARETLQNCSKTLNYRIFKEAFIF